MTAPPRESGTAALCPYHPMESQPCPICLHLVTVGRPRAATIRTLKEEL